MRDNTSRVNQTYHKEESVFRIKSDHIDRNSLSQKRQVCIDSIDPLQQIINNSSIYVDKATELGKPAGDI